MNDLEGSSFGLQFPTRSGREEAAAGGGATRAIEFGKGSEATYSNTESDM